MSRPNRVEDSPHPGPIRWLVAAERGLSVLLLAGVAGVMMAQVIARYVFDTPILWSEEFARFGLIWLTFVASGAVMANGEHIQVDLFGNRLGPRARVGMEVFAALIVIVTCAMLLPAGLRFARGLAGNTSPMMGMPMTIWYSAVVVGFVLLMLHSVVNIVMALVRGRSIWDRKAGTSEEQPLGGMGT